MLDLQYFPVTFLHIYTVINFGIALWLAILIIMAAVEDFLLETMGNGNEHAGLLSDENHLHSGEVRQEKRKWNELLNRNVEFIVPYFITVFFIENVYFKSIEIIHEQNNFYALIYATLAFQIVFLVGRFCHAIGYLVEIYPLRAFGMAISAIANIGLACLAVSMAFIGYWPESETDPSKNWTKFAPSLNLALRALSILILVIVIKIHVLHFVGYYEKYFQRNLPLALRLEHMARNDAESFVPMCGLLAIWKNIFWMIRDISVTNNQDILPYYNFNGFVIACWVILILFVAFRVAYSVFYFRALQPFRTVFYAFGLVALLLWGFLAFGVLVDYTRRFDYENTKSENYNFKFKLMLTFAVLTMLEVLRSVFVSYSTVYFRHRKERQPLNSEDHVLIFNNGVIVEKNEDASHELATSERLQRIHLSDNAFQLLFFYVINMFMDDPDLYNHPKLIAAIVLASAFVAIRYILPFTTEFVARNPILKLVATFVAVGILLALLVWFFVEQEIYITNFHQNEPNSRR